MSVMHTFLLHLKTENHKIHYKINMFLYIQEADFPAIDVMLGYGHIQPGHSPVIQNV